MPKSVGGKDHELVDYTSSHYQEPYSKIDDYELKINRIRAYAGGGKISISITDGSNKKIT